VLPRPVLPALAAAAVLLGAGAGATPAQAIARSCAWTVQITGDQVNALYPDEAAKYWIAVVPLPEGGRAVLHGQFPHARYTSFNTYTPQTQAIDALHDTQIAPDPGSANPYRRGADRRAAPRAYTLTVVKGRLPRTGRAPNTIYTENADGTKSGNTAAIALRIYRTDRGLDIDGGVPLPSVTSYGADGRRLLAYPGCPDTSLPDLGLTPALASSGLGTLPTGGPSLLARNPPSWHKYVNTQTAVVDEVTDNDVSGPAVRPPLAGLTTTAFPAGGFGENIDNKYVYSLFSRQLGAVLVLRGTLPTFPRTYDGQRRMGTGQLRYWSLCAESQATQYYACRTDDELPLAAGRRYTIMMSAAASRPADATTACGVAWLPAGPLPQSVLLLRNMLPSASFAQAVQRVQPGHEAEQMGPYLPRGTYYPTPLAAERAVGCAPGTVSRGR
jgi:hypothetical protein